MQQDAFTDELDGYSFELRYEGKDAISHMIDMSSLSASIDGFSRIYSAVGHFVATGQYAKQMPALSVKTYVMEPQAKCFSLPGMLQFAVNSGIFQGLAAAAFTLILGYVLNRNSANKEEMKHLRELFEKQLGYSQAATEKMLSTIDKLATGLQPSVKKSMTPIGESCDRIDLYLDGRKHQTVDQAMKDMANADEPSELSPEQTYKVVITELDRLKSSAKVHFSAPDIDEDLEDDGSPRRIPADITDPAIALEGNAYLSAFVAGTNISIRAKALLRGGLVVKLYISDSL
ncbi:TPA: hypothetical protein N0H29_000590 [Pseudomonas aeruginosa]|nr:hypothetical protein [Pseudomonas aeruginosa]